METYHSITQLEYNNQTRYTKTLQFLLDNYRFKKYSLKMCDYHFTDKIIENIKNVHTLDLTWCIKMYRR